MEDQSSSGVRRVEEAEMGEGYLNINTHTHTVITNHIQTTGEMKNTAAYSICLVSVL
jgi:hypothetical protein